MPRTSKNITLEGQYARGVLGAFRIIRGFATLQELAQISAPFPMVPPAHPGEQAQGHQREINEAHAESIRRYLQDGKFRFIPEIILSVRAEYRDEVDQQQMPIGIISDTTPGLIIQRRWTNKNLNTHQIKVSRDEIDNLIAQKCIRRIDGNHRLYLASELEEDAHNPTKYLAPFCAILLAPPGDENDDYTESMLFHVINSTALPLDSEHALQLVLSQLAHFQTPDDEFATSPVLHLTRILKGKIDTIPTAQRNRIGAKPATVLHEAAKALIDSTPHLLLSRENQDEFADAFCGSLNDLLSRLTSIHPEFCKADYFIELAALIWRETSKSAPHDERVNEAVATLEHIGRWLGRDGFHRIQAKRSLAYQIFEIYKAVQKRVPKRVFLARWYPTDDDGQEKTNANLRLQMIQRALEDLRSEGINLVLDDPGTHTGGTYPIHQEMYRAIAENDIILIDMSGVRPNVCIEAGYALEQHKADRLIFIFESTQQTTNNRAFTQPPFDLSTFKYERITQAADIPDKIKPHIRAIWEKAVDGAI